jgi:hypothetical protein
MITANFVHELASGYKIERPELVEGQSFDSAQDADFVASLRSDEIGTEFGLSSGQTSALSKARRLLYLYITLSSYAIAHHERQNLESRK